MNITNANPIGNLNQDNPLGNPLEILGEDVSLCILSFLENTPGGHNDLHQLRRVNKAWHACIDTQASLYYQRVKKDSKLKNYVSFTMFLAAQFYRKYNTTNVSYYARLANIVHSINNKYDFPINFFSDIDTKASVENASKSLPPPRPSISFGGGIDY